jgi:photoactive yellow protein
MQEQDLAVLPYDQPNMLQVLDSLSEADLDLLTFGVIHIDHHCTVLRYNRYEALKVGLDAHRVIGKNFFSKVAMCMNNFMVALRLEDAFAAGASLDVSMDYVLTGKLKPTSVKLRLLTAPEPSRGYVLIHWA